jgi:hypothetical protein
MQEPPCPSQGVIIVGAGYGVDNVLKYSSQHPDHSIWCVSLAYPQLISCKAPILIFETHTPDLWPPFAKYHKSRNLVTLQPTEAIYCLPTQELIAEFGNMFTSTFAWMIAYAIHKKVKEIALFGITLNSNEEIDQRNAVEFLIGCAYANGIKTVISRLSPLYYMCKSTNMKGLV